MTSAPYSILFGRSRPTGVDDTPEPDYFRDLRLDQVVAALIGGPDQFHLAPLYYAMLGDPATLLLRQDLFDDVADSAIRAVLDRFSDDMAATHQALRASRNRARRSAAVRADVIFWSRCAIRSRR